MSFTEFLHHFFINKKSEIFSQTSKGERGESGNKKDRERERERKRAIRTEVRREMEEEG